MLTGQPHAAIRCHLPDFSPLCFSCSTQYEGQDVLSDSQLFEALGVGLGPAEMYGVMLAQKRLGDDPLVDIKMVSGGAGMGRGTLMRAYVQGWDGCGIWSS